MLKDTQNLKGLQSQMAILNGKIESKKSEIENSQKELQQYLNTKVNLHDKIDKLKPKTDLRVSEHALLRVIQRKYGIDLEEVEKLILEDPTLLEVRDKLPNNGKFPLKDGGKVVIKNNNIVTYEN